MEFFFANIFGKFPQNILYKKSSFELFPEFNKHRRMSKKKNVVACASE